MSLSKLTGTARSSPAGLLINSARAGPSAFGAASGIAAAIVGILYLTKHCHLRLRVESGQFCFSMDYTDPMTDPYRSVARSGVRESNVA
jgi:hypothetical protein